MSLSSAVDAYCERAAPGFWAEPLNAASNLAFLIAAALLWRSFAAARGVGAGVPGEVRALRLPFYVLPADLLILAPVLFFFDQEALVSVGVSAVNGGLIPWQRGIETSFGRFQFVLGREVAVYLFGRTKTPDALVTYSTGENGIEDIFVISYGSTQLEFPIVEYRPFRSFDADQRSSLFIQIYAAADFPHDVVVLESVTGTTIPPELESLGASE